MVTDCVLVTTGGCVRLEVVEYTRLPDCGGVRLVVVGSGCCGCIWGYQTIQEQGFVGDSNAVSVSVWLLSRDLEFISTT